jgi:ketosteroid isomerase-like protein
MDQARLTAVEDRIAIEDVICAVTLHSDLNDPALALAQYSEDAVIDYSSLSGPQSANVPVRQHRERLLTFLPGFDSRQHQVTNFLIQVTGDTAIATSQAHAVHFLGGDCWEVWGTYHHRLRRTTAGWKITYQRADLVHQTGEHLVAKATGRVTAANASR